MTRQRAKELLPIKPTEPREFFLRVAENGHIGDGFRSDDDYAIAEWRKDPKSMLKVREVLE